jgi:aldose 1-epimerase
VRRPPSGGQIEVASGDWRLTVVEVGGGIRTLRHRDWDVLDGYPLGRMCHGARGQPLIPWPNRIDQGRYTFDGQSFQLALTEPSRSGAIHGLTRWSRWSVLDRGAASIVMAYTLDPQPGYPFSLALELHYHLGDDGLVVRTTAENVGDARCPFGVGFHPYFSCGDAHVDASLLHVPAAEYLLTDSRGIPKGRSPVEGSPVDFRSLRPIGALALDHSFASLRRDLDGRSRVRLVSADERRRIAVWLDESYRYVEIFSGDTLPEGERRRGLGVEPMTCPPNAFATGEAVRALEPGESWQCAWGVVAENP